MSEITNKIIDFLNKCQSDPKCAYCGSDKLELLRDTEGAIKYVSILWGTLNKGMPQYAVGCTNCGHIHLFAKKHIDSKNGITEE